MLLQRFVQRRERNAIRLAAHVADRLAQSHEQLRDRLAAAVAEEVHRNVAHMHAHLAGQLGDARHDLHQAVAHMHTHLAGQLGAELGRQLGDARHDLHQAVAHMHAHLAGQLGAELGRQLGDARHDLHQAVAHMHAHLAGQLGAELGRQKVQVDHEVQQTLTRIHTWLAETLARNHADALADLHKHMGHVDAHLSEHLTKQIALQIGAGATAAPHGQPQTLQQRLRSLGRHLRPVAADGMRKLRVGGDADGGYVLLDDFARIDFALSLGVGQDITWDLAIAERGIAVHQFDHTVEQPPATHPRIHFHRRRIAAVRQGADETLQSAQQLGGDALCIVKMDIEGDEWSVLAAATARDFRQVPQFICEFHDFDRVGDEVWYNRASAVMAALAESFCVVHVHGNNNAPLQCLGNVAFPEILEVTFANKAFYTFTETQEIFPTDLDAANRQDLPDIFLGAFRF